MFNIQTKTYLILFIHLICLFLVFRGLAADKNLISKCQINQDPLYQKILLDSEYQKIKNLTTDQRNEMTKQIDQQLKEAKLKLSDVTGFFNIMKKTTTQLNLLSLHVYVLQYCEKPDEKLLQQIQDQIKLHLETLK